jgi:nucleoside-diphosphate-sugar epimerase
VSTSAASVLVTGGTGVIGSSIVRRLLAAGRSVRILSRSGAAAAQAGVAMCRGDVTRDADLAAALSGCDAVVHCAAEKGDVRTMEQVNVAATRRLLALAADSQIRFFCHMSSVAVVGRTSAMIVDETTPCHPMTRYAETKLRAEEIVRRGLPGGTVVILRPTSVFSVHTLPAWLRHSIRHRFRQFLTGRENAHLIYVEDVAASAVHWLHAAARQPVDTFIVSSDEEGGNTHRQVQAALASMIKAAPAASDLAAPLWLPHLTRLLRLRGSNRGDLVYSADKLRRAGFHMPYGLRNGLGDAVSLWRNR